MSQNHIPGRIKLKGERFHHTTQNLKFIIFRIFHLTFSDHDYSQVTETMGSKTSGKWGTNVHKRF